MTHTWLITGASRGLGRSMTSQLLDRGHRVVAAVRSPEGLAQLRDESDGRLSLLELDVTDDEQLRAGVDAAFTEHDDLDVVISNAGIGVFAAAEDYTDEQIGRMVATNLVGSIQLARAVTPYFRARGGGKFVQVSSMGGQLAFPGFSMYHATKWGIEGFIESYAQEVAGFGIQTMLVEPGMVRTSFYDAATRVAVSEPYRNTPADREATPLDQMPDGEDETARAIIERASDDRLPARLLLGTDAYRLVTSAVRDRLADLETQADSAKAADLPPDQVTHAR